MLCHLLRAFLILLVAGILAGGIYTLVNTGLVQSMAPAAPEARPEPSADMTISSSSEVNEFSGEEGSFDRRPPEDLSIWLRLTGILGHLAVIAIIITIVVYGQKLVGWIALKLSETWLFTPKKQSP